MTRLTTYTSGRFFNESMINWRCWKLRTPTVAEMVAILLWSIRPLIDVK